MQHLKILNSRQTKKIKIALKEHFGEIPKLDYVFIQNNNNRIFLINKNLVKIDLNKLKVERIGLYFAEFKDNHIRLSKEGAQLLVQLAKKQKIKLNNLVELSKEEVKEYFKGLDINKDLGEENKAIILTFKDNIIGYAKYKENKIINYLPKIHRGTVIV